MIGAPRNLYLATKALLQDDVAAAKGADVPFPLPDAALLPAWAAEVHALTGDGAPELDLTLFPFEYALPLSPECPPWPSPPRVPWS